MGPALVPVRDVIVSISRQLMPAGCDDPGASSICHSPRDDDHVVTRQVHREGGRLQAALQRSQRIPPDDRGLYYVEFTATFCQAARHMGLSRNGAGTPTASSQARRARPKTAKSRTACGIWLDVTRSRRSCARPPTARSRCRAWWVGCREQQEPSPESLLKKLLLDFRVTASEGELPRDVGELLVYARDRREDIESKLYELVLILNERELDLSEADVTTQRGEIRVQQEKMEDLMDEMAAQAQARDTASTEHEQIVARRAIRDATSKFTTAQGEASTAQANLNAGKRFLVSLRKAVARDKRVEAQRKEASEATTRSVNKQHRLARSTASWRSSES